MAVPENARARRGDLVLFAGGGGLMIDDLMMIHASRAAGKVAVEPARRFVRAGRGAPPPAALTIAFRLRNEQSPAPQEGGSGNEQRDRRHTAGLVPAAVASLGLLWSLFGVAMYLQKVGMFGDPLAGDDRRRTVALAESVPAWVTGAFAIAVFAGAARQPRPGGAEALGQAAAVLSLLAVAGPGGWILFMSGAREVHGMAAIAMPALITLVAILLVWLAGVGIRRGWLS